MSKRLETKEPDTVLEGMQCAIIAGGLATRLRPLTNAIPKSLVPVCGKPFLVHQIDLLKKNGIVDLVLLVGYLGTQIEKAFGDGKNFGITITYSYELERLLGTGGAIRNALPVLKDSFFVLYGDSYLETDYRSVYYAYKKAQTPALIVVYRNENKWDTSNIVFKNNRVILYNKKTRTPEMEYIDYGLSVLSKRLIETIPPDREYDLSDLYHILSVSNQLAGYEVKTRFYEIGSKSGLKDFESYIAEKNSNKRQE